jgi:hypothetical protein
MLGDARADHLMRTDRAPVYALLADAAPYFREHNPELSARLMAAWQRAGAKLGDYYWYDLAFLDPDMEAKAGVPSSARIDGLGALMRSDQGDYLLLKAAGRPADACAMDEGGILWYGDAMPIIAAVGMRGTSQDNGLDAATGWLARLVSRNNSCVSFSGATLHPRLSGTLTAFKSTPLADYAAVRVERPDLPEPGAWTRHAIWIKPTGDAQHQYLILLDHIQAAAQSQWNLNLPIGQMSVSPAKGGGRLVRIGDKAEGAVSVFFASPRNADVSTSAKQLTLAASKTTHHYQTLSVGQAGGENRYYLTIMAVSKQAAAAPEFIVLEPGKVIEIRGADETYRLFASSNAFTYNKKGVRFTGKLALIRSAGKTHDLFLVDGELVVLDADR